MSLKICRFGVGFYFKALLFYLEVFYKIDYINIIVLLIFLLSFIFNILLIFKYK